MSVILWNRTTQNVVMVGEKARVFVSSAEATANLNLGLLTRLTEEAVRARLPLPVIDQLTVV